MKRKQLKGKNPGKKPSDPLVDKSSRKLSGLLVDLFILLRDKAPYGWEDAVKILVKIGKEDLQTLINLPKYDEFDIRSMVVEALVRIGNETVEPLIDALENKNQNLDRVIEALGRLKEPRAVDLLIKLLEDPKISSRAAYALAEIKDPRAIEPLIKILVAEEGCMSLKMEVKSLNLE